MGELLQKMMDVRDQKQQPFIDAIAKAESEKVEVEDRISKVLRQLKAEERGLDAEILEAERKAKFDLADEKIEAKKVVEEKIQAAGVEFSMRMKELDAAIAQAENGVKQVAKTVWNQFFMAEGKKGHEELEVVLRAIDERWNDITLFAAQNDIELRMFSDKERFGISMTHTRNLYEKLMNWAAFGPMSG